MGRGMTSGNLGGIMASAVVCTDFSSKELHRQVRMGKVVSEIRVPRWCSVICTDYNM